ncbi:hypothetical protein PINS_up023224 [Pythium insidiosum]|nr:hypothetical protein PINS_up023224 [Pythium insidiosum]
MPPRRQLEPAMLAVGVLEGTVDDIVFALHEGTAEEMKAMAAFSGDDSMFDAVVLHTLKQNRTTYLGLKWKLSRTPGGNRDMCFIEYVGVANDSKGQRFGFRVIESVKLRHCPPFDDNSIIRTDLSFCYLFRETGTPGLVDVFMQGAFDSSADVVTAGGVGDARSTMEMLLSVESCMERAEAKKLGELVAKQAQQPPRPQSGSQCSICRAKPGLLSSHLLCQGCGVVICTKCRMKKVIISKRGAKQKVSCCKICLVNVKDKSPFEGESIPTQQPMQKKSSVSSMSPHRSVGSAAGVPLPVSRSTSNESAASAIGGHHAPPHDARARAVGQEQARAPAHDRRLAQRHRVLGVHAVVAVELRVVVLLGRRRHLRLVLAQHGRRPPARRRGSPEDASGARDAARDDDARRCDAAVGARRDGSTRRCRRAHGPAPHGALQPDARAADQGRAGVQPREPERRPHGPPAVDEEDRDDR